MRRVDDALALSALRFMASDDNRPKHIDERAPPKVHFHVLYNLAEGGFLEHASDTHFAISQKGLEALATGVLDWPPRASDRPTTKGPPAYAEGKEDAPRSHRRKRTFVTQKQIAAVFKAAKQIGICVEMRIEGDTIRFVPCDGSSPVRSEDRDDGPKPYF